MKALIQPRRDSPVLGTQRYVWERGSGQSCAAKVFNMNHKVASANCGVVYGMDQIGVASPDLHGKAGGK